MDWSAKRVIVTGGAGFLGSFVVQKLRQRQSPVVPRSNTHDLRDRDAILGSCSRPNTTMARSR